MVAPDPAQRLAALAVLGLTDPVSRRALTEAYRRLARQTHPDAVGSSDPESARRFTDIADAYRLLSTQPLPAGPAAPAPAAAARPVSEPAAPPADIPVRIRRTTAATSPIVAGPVRVSPARRRRRPGPPTPS